MKPSSRADIAPFYVMEVMQAAADRVAAGHDVLHLEVGQPSTSAPEAVLDAAAAALRDDRLGYTTASGVPALREAIAGHYAAVHRLTIEPRRIVVTAGASGGCVLSFLAAFDAGDRVAVTEPGYPCYRNMLEAFGVEVVGIPIDAAGGYILTPEALDGVGAIDGVVIASPSNPTGTALSGAALDAILAWADDRGVRVVSDEIYQGISHVGKLPTAAAHGDHVVLQSFSKYYSMTGWRLGWLVAPDDLLPGIVRLAQNLFISPPTLSQLAAVAAFESTAELDGHLDRYRTNRDILLTALGAAGFHDIAPAHGGFYLYADVGFTGLDSQTLCARWLDEIGVAATPGIDFDPRRGHRFVRFSYSESTDDITEAAARLVDWMGRNRPAAGLG